MNWEYIKFFVKEYVKDSLGEIKTGFNILFSYKLMSKLLLIGGVVVLFFRRDRMLAALLFLLGMIYTIANSYTGGEYKHRWRKQKYRKV